MRKKLMATAAALHTHAQPSTDISPEPSSHFVDPRTFGLNKAGYSINEVVEIQPLGRTALYEAIKDGRLPIRKAGKRTIVLARDLASFLSELPKARVSPGPKAA